jgi:hypothetical protein
LSGVERKLYRFYRQKEATKTLSSLFANECDLGTLTFAPLGVVPGILLRNSGIGRRNWFSAALANRLLQSGNHSVVRVINNFDLCPSPKIHLATESAI